MTFWKKLFGEKPATGQPVEDDFDPAILLERAQREMQEMHARNRESAVRAISEKNNLEQIVIETERKIIQLKARAEIAEKHTDTSLAAELQKELYGLEQSLVATRSALENAVAVAEQVKASIRSEEEKIRKKTAEALLLKAQWNTMQVQRSLFATLVEVNTGVAREVPDAERAVRHVLNRRFVRQAVVQRDNLRQMQVDTEKRVTLLRTNAQQARAQNNDALENALLREMEQYEAMLVQTRDAVHKADEVTESAIRLLRDEEDTLRAQGLDPAQVSDEQLALYEARRELAAVEDTRSVRQKRHRSAMGLIALLVVLAIISILLSFV